ncbi:DUF6285 domain-containing protein [Azospirillum halopraeferens]|uniref:DUF6285 domain-containing protein n=1 Tax=Azospirillum halopraeferens TaxID=34010 RepID=UPI00048E4742|nr:DUF6285 domain-containing protein [Azospirillum halopraeferens]
MRNDPDARRLLAAALDAYRAEVLPVVPPERRYTALMIANAMAIAARELDGLDAAGHAMMAAMIPLVGSDADESLSGAALSDRVDALQRRLCADIAAGAYDRDAGALLDCLDATVRARLAIANPKLLEG